MAIANPSSTDSSTAARQVAVGCADTPLGPFGAVFTSRGLAQLSFPPDGLDYCEAWARRWAPQAEIAHHSAQLDRLSEQLTAYLEGSLREFSIPLDMRGTPFQRAVWEALLTIPYGETRSYAQIAQQIGRPKAVRAVGAANGANPVSIIVPCHRVVGSNGTLTGYGGGLDMKERLLQLEGIRLPLG